MKIKGQISFSNNGEYISVEIGDKNASVNFCTFELKANDLLALLGNRHGLPVDLEVMALEKIGKFHVHKKFTFEMPDDVDYTERKEIANNMAQFHCPKGWHPDLHFSSQDSFFSENGKNYASCTIRSYVDSLEEKEKILKENEPVKTKKKR